LALTDPDNILDDMPEWEAWGQIKDLWNSAGDALSQGEAVTGKERQQLQKSLKKKSRKKHTEVAPLK